MTSINSFTKYNKSNKAVSKIICTPVDTHGLQFSNINISTLKPIIFKTPYITQKKSPKKFTFDKNVNKQDELSLIHKYSLIEAFEKLSDFISIKSINDQISELNVCIEFIRNQLVKEKTIKNKIDMMILREAYENIIKASSIKSDENIIKQIRKYIN